MHITNVNRTVNKILANAGYCVRWYSPYHGRIGENVDVFCNKKRNGVKFTDCQNGNKNFCPDEKKIADAIGDYIFSGRKDHGKDFHDPYFPNAKDENKPPVDAIPPNEWTGQPTNNSNCEKMNFGVSGEFSETLELGKAMCKIFGKKKELSPEEKALDEVRAKFAIIFKGKDEDSEWERNFFIDIMKDQVFPHYKENIINYVKEKIGTTQAGKPSGFCRQDVLDILDSIK